MLKKLMLLFILLTISVISISCSWLGGNDDTSVVGGGNITVAVSLENAGSSGGVRATTYNKVFFRLLDETNDVIDEANVSSSNSVVLHVFNNLTAEKEYKIIAWTEDSDGDVIHSPDTGLVFVEANENNPVVLNLKPRVGSIIMQFIAVPTSIKEFYLSFDSDSGYFETTVPRVAGNTYVPLNKVPYGSTGTLYLEIRDSKDDLYFEWNTPFTFRKENVSIELSLVSTGSISFNMEIDVPYNTVITAFTDVKKTLSEEKNIGVLVTEFCVNGTNNADFVEIANLSSETVFFNNLLLEVVGASTFRISATNVSIEPNGTFVFGNTTAPEYWGEGNIDVTGNLPMVTSSATIMLYGDGELLDYVAYYAGNNPTDWPRLPSATTSWEIKELVADPKYNNFGGNWRLSSGSPGTLEQ